MTENLVISGVKWKALYDKAKARYVAEELGARPTRKSIRKKSNYRVEINLLERLAIGVLVVIAIFTSIKMGAVAVPYAQSVLKHLTHAQDASQISPVVSTAFTLVTVVLFAMLATPALIYFQLLAKDPIILKEITETAKYPWHKRLSLAYVTPRIPEVGVYLVTLWLVYVSWAGDGSLFDKYVVVWFEIGLAHLVGTILARSREYNELIDEAYDSEVSRYDKALERFDKSRKFLQILYVVVSDYLRSTYPARFAKADANTMEAAVWSVFEHHQHSTRFAERVMREGVSVDEDSDESADLPTPPNGTYWTADSIVNYLRLNYRGETPTERTIAQIFGRESGAVKAWRSGGGKALWLQHQSENS
jgi:hypothetical protein